MAVSLRNAHFVLPSGASTHPSASSTIGAEIGTEPTEPLRNIADLVSKGQIDLAIQSARGISNELLQSYALLNLTRILCSTGDFDRATKVADSIPDPEEQSEALLSISRALTTNEKIDQALEIASRIPNPVMSSSALRDVSEELLTIKDVEKAHEVFNRAVWVTGHIPFNNFSKLNIHFANLRDTLGSIGKIFAERHDFDRLRQLRSYQAALRVNWFDGSVFFFDKCFDNDLLNSVEKCIAQNNLDRAEECIKHCEGTFKFRAARQVSKALLVSGDTEGAIRVAHNSSEDGLSSETARLICDVLLANKDVIGAKTLALSLPENPQSQQSIKTELLKKIILDCATVGDFSQAISLLEEFPDTHHCVYSKVIGKWAVAGHIVEAMAHLERLRDKHLKIHCKAQVAAAFAKAGKVRSAEMVLKDVPEGSENNCTVKKARSHIARAQLNSGNSTRALEVVAGRKHEYKIRTERALQLITESKIDAALDIIRKASLDYQRESYLKEDVSIALAKAEEYKQAIFLARSIHLEQRRDNALQKIAMLLAQNGSVDLAKKAANSIEINLLYKAFALLVVELTPNPIDTAQGTT